MKKIIRLIAIPTLVGAAFFLAGCASYTIQPVSKDTDPWNGTTHTQGYVFYQPELYFLVTSAPAKAAGDTSPTTDKGDKPVPDDAKPVPAPAPTLTVTPIYLPNPDKPYRVTTFNFLAKSDFTFNFKDGWQLTSIADKADNSGVATALVGQMATIMKTVKIMAVPAQPLPKSFLLHPNYSGGVITSFTPILLPE
ncbi:MAG: hypothetical protein WBN75_15960 [Verrucomicrobiia bacterium]